MPSLARFTKPETFRRFSPKMLAELLSRYPELLEARGIELPEVVDESSMPYRKITELFLSVDEVSERNSGLYAAIHLIERLSTAPGRGAILRVATLNDVILPREAAVSNSDLALWTWLHHPHVLESAGYRVKMHSSRSYLYYRSFDDRVPSLCYSEETVAELQRSLRSYYQSISKGSSVQVLDIEEEDELWLVIRHGGYMERRANIDDETNSTGSICFRDEEYDILIYNQIHGDLKIRYTNDKMLEVLRTEFGRLFFGNANFFTARETFTLGALMQPACSFMATTLVAGITSVVLLEVRYMMPGGCDRTVHEKSTNLLHSQNHHAPVVPGKAFLVEYVKLGFKFEGDRNYRSIKLFAPNKSNYARESDAGLVEQWLRKAGLMQAAALEENVAVA